MFTNMMMSHECSHIVSFIVWAFRDNKNGFKGRYFFDNLRQSFDEIDQSFRNTWPSEEESDIIIFEMMCFSDCLDICIYKVFFISMIIVHTIVDCNELLIRKSEINSKIIFGIIGDTDIFIIMKFEDQRFKKFIEKSLSSYKSISKFSKNFMDSQDDLLVCDSTDDA